MMPVRASTNDRPSFRRPLVRTECNRLLADVGWGVLATAEACGEGDATPIGVPVSYALRGDQIFLTMSRGRKLTALEHNPRLSLTVTDVHSLRLWRSVLVIGQARWLEKPADRAEAARAFLETSERPGWELTPDDAGRLARSNLAAIAIDEVHGYASMIEPNRDDCAARAMNSLRRVVRCLHEADAQAAQSLGLTAAQLFVLREVSKAEPQTISGLADATATSQGSVSEVVTRLVAREMLTRQRSDTDRRCMEIRLTPSGRELVDRAAETVQEHLIAGFQRLPNQTQRSLSECLETWLMAAGLSDVGPSMFFEPAVSLTG